MKVEMIAITPNAEVVIEQCGRVCYQSKLGNPSIIKAWIKATHESVLEHASATFIVSEISRACSHQLVRARIASFSQQSQRYVKEKQFGYVIPETIQSHDRLHREYQDLMSAIQAFYDDAVEQGVTKEDARMVLPNACHTEIAITMNMREFRHTIGLRCDKHSQWEIRQLFGNILMQLNKECPNVFFDLAERYLEIPK